MYYPSRRRKSKKLFILATVVAASIFAGAFFLIKNSSSDEVVAKINGHKIFKSEIETKLRDVFSGQDQNAKSPEVEKLPKEVIEILAKEVYLEKELTTQALKSDAVKTEEVKNKIIDSKNKIIRQAYVDSVLQKEITSDKINNKYLELSKELEGKKEYSISHIVVKTKEEAEKILKELKSKKSDKNKFAELAKKYSIDQESAPKGGDLDYILEDSMIKEMAAAVSSLQKNEVSQPVETKFGWHLVKIADIREAKPLSFEAVKDNIKDQLIQEKVNELNNKILNNAKIQILIQLQDIEKSKAPKNVEPSAPTEAETPAQAIPENAQPAAEPEVTTNSETEKQVESDTTKSNQKADAPAKKYESKSKR